MCMYDPPLLLGTPDLSAALICALPLTASATRASEFVFSSLGLVAGYLAAHFAIVALHQAAPPSVFYWMPEQASVVPTFLFIITVALLVLYGASRAIEALWSAEYLRAALYFLLALGLIGAVLAWFAHSTSDALGFDLPTRGTLAFNGAAPQQPFASDGIMLTDCFFPPFGEGPVGYGMLAVLVIFELLVAIGIANALHRMTARS